MVVLATSYNIVNSVELTPPGCESASTTSASYGGVFWNSIARMNPIQVPTGAATINSDIHTDYESNGSIEAIKSGPYMNKNMEKNPLITLAKHTNPNKLSSPPSKAMKRNRPAAFPANVPSKMIL